MINGPLFAIVQTLMPQRLRAVSISLIYLFGNLVGMGLGPLAIGALSDRFRPWAERSRCVIRCWSCARDICGPLGICGAAVDGTA